MYFFIIRGDFFSFMTMCKKIYAEKSWGTSKKLVKDGGGLKRNRGTGFQDKIFTNFLFTLFTTNTKEEHYGEGQDQNVVVAVNDDVS